MATRICVRRGTHVILNSESRVEYFTEALHHLTHTFFILVKTLFFFFTKKLSSHLQS